MTSSYETFTGDKNTATGKPYNWYDQRASTWYEGYGPGGGPSHTNAGSFVDLQTLTEGTADYNKALDAITNNIIGLFEQKGITAAQAKASDDYKNLINLAKAGDTKGAFQGAAAAVTSASDRGDLFGADSTEGGDKNYGASFLKAVADPEYAAANDIDVSGVTVNDLYSKGLLREADTAGLNYHNNNLANNRSIAEIAGDFLASDEASLQKGYHQQYGRTGAVHLITDENTGEVTVDHSKGLGYWIKDNEAKDTGISDLQNFLNVTSYRGEDQDGDGKVSPEERLTSKYHMSAETLVRDDMRNILGQVSSEADKANIPFYTAAQKDDVQRYVDYIRNARTGGTSDPNTGERTAGVGNEGAAFDDSLFTNTHIGYRGLTMDSLNQGDADDFRGYDLDGDGQVTGDEIVASPTGMGRFGTVAEVKEYMDAHSGVDSDNLSAAQASGKFKRDYGSTNAYGQKVFDSVHPKVWGAVTDEDPYKTYVPWEDPFGGTVTKKELEALLLPENLDHWKKNSSLWLPNQGKNKGKGPIGEDGWRINPTTPDLPTPLSVDRKDINYMPNVSSDVQDTSGYGQAKTQFDQAVTAAAPDIRTAQGQAGQRFTGTSAKGVRMKRSKASRMGTIRGTKQLGREQQIKSLNI